MVPRNTTSPLPRYSAKNTGASSLHLGVMLFEAGQALQHDQLHVVVALSVEELSVRRRRLHPPTPPPPDSTQVQQTNTRDARTKRT